MRKDTLEEEVSNSLKTLYKMITDHPVLENIPEWLGMGVIESARHFQDYGVAFYDIKTAAYFLTIIAVIFMFIRKKVGFKIYVLAQIVSVFAVFYGLGLNSASIIATITTGLIALVFILLYKKWFLKEVNSIN